MHEGLVVRQAIGAQCHVSGILGDLAAAQAQAGRPAEGLVTIDEALAIVEKTDEWHWAAELCRLKGELLLGQGSKIAAEASLRKAVEVARRQQAKSWELRATMSLCRLWRNQGKAGDARQMLVEIYGWFTEGFDSPDLVKARTLLAELA